jgi:hypothetical protein
MSAVWTTNADKGHPGSKAGNKIKQKRAEDRMENELGCVLLDESEWVSLKCRNQSCESVQVAKYLIKESSAWTKGHVGKKVITGHSRCQKCRAGGFNAPEGVVYAQMLYRRKSTASKVISSRKDPQSFRKW